MASISIAEAVRSDLEKLPDSVREGALAVAALAVAGMLDSTSSEIDGSYRDSAALLKELRATMAELRDHAAVSPGQEEDTVDRIIGAGPGQSGTVVSFRARGGRQQLG